MLEYLKEEGVSPGLLKDLEAYRAQYPTPADLAGRVPEPRYRYYGKEVWEAAIAALLCGKTCCSPAVRRRARTSWQRT